MSTIAGLLMGDAAWHVELGDALEVLRSLPDASFHAMLSDPPAGVNFMSKAWDSDKGGRAEWVAWLAAIMREAYRVLTPGAWGFVWALPRQTHWTACALEDAGFELRDRHSHFFATGYAKSLDVARAISVYLCTSSGRHFMSTLPPKEKLRPGDHVCPDHPRGAPWIGHGTALKPAVEDWWLVRKPLKGTVAENALAFGTGGLDVDAGRVGLAGGTTKAGQTPDAASRGAYGRGLNGSYAVPIDAGRFPAHLSMEHAEGCRLLGERFVRSSTLLRTHQLSGSENLAMSGRNYPRRPRRDYAPEGLETIGAWECVPGCPVRELDQQSGDRPGGRPVPAETASVPFGGPVFGEGRPRQPFAGYNDNGGLSRCFTTFRYEPKASTAERELGCEGLPLRTVEETVDREQGSAGADSPRAGAGRGSGARNFHPTIKAIRLTRWLAGLIRPPAVIVPRRRLLVPFSGSGSEMIGGLRAGLDSVLGIEQDPDFVRIAEARLARWAEVPTDLDEREAASAAEAPPEQQLSIFGERNR